jgi:SAM-dependent methyltransferase
MDRKQKLLECVDLTAQHGLEIGALHHPVLTKAEAHVRYVDHADTATLREKYAQDDAVDDMVEVDVVWGDGSLAAALNATGDTRVDFVLASHVIEHVPDLIGWLDELAEVLPTGGVVTLAIPDKRYCFDARRRTTDVSEIIDAWMAGRRRPSAGAVFDFYSRIIEVDTAAVWAGTAQYDTIPPNYGQGLEWAQKAAATDEYSDVHCWVFTPESFMAVMRALFELGLVAFSIVSFHATDPGELEFHVSLRRLDPTVDDETRRKIQLASLPDRIASAGTQDAVVLAVSRREAALVQRKRQVMAAARRLFARHRPDH